MGQTSLMMVFAFNIIFALMGFRLADISSDSYINFINYYNQATAHNVSASAANIAASSFWQNTTAWTPPSGSINCMGGTFTMSYTAMDSGRYQIVSNSTYGITYYTGILGILTTKTCTSADTLLLGSTYFSRYAYYSELESPPGGPTIYWTTGDTMWGPMHSQQTLNISGNPVFEGKVTTNGGINKQNGSSDHPQFLGGLQTGVSQTIPENLNPLMTAADSLHGGRTFDGNGFDVTIDFKTNGKVVVTKGKSSTHQKVDSTWHAPTKHMVGHPSHWDGTYNNDGYYSYTYTNITDTTWTITTYDSVASPMLAPNGLINVTDGNVRIKGTVSGRVTVAATGATGAADEGNVYIDSSVVLKNDPKLHPSSTDVLGIVAENSVIITDNSKNNNGVKLYASIFTRAGGLTAENYDSRGVDGTLMLYGGVQQHQRQPVGTFTTDSHGNKVINSGFSKSYYYDTRFLNAGFFPPFYPPTQSFEVLSWYEQ